MLREVWSGGQTGTDIAGLRAAAAVGIATGCWMPKGWRTEAGPQPQYRTLYRMRETDSADYPPRTLANVEGCDATLVIGDRPNSRGCSLTVRCCLRLGKPYRILTSDDLGEPDSLGDIAALLIDKRVHRLNIAGNRDASEGQIEWWLQNLFRLVQQMNRMSSVEGSAAIH